MATVVSCIEGTNLLGLPIISTELKGKFRTTASSSINNELESWSCTDTVYGVVFDTTNSNTGIHNGTCVLLQKVLERKVL